MKRSQSNSPPTPSHLHGIKKSKTISTPAGFALQNSQVSPGKDLDDGGGEWSKVVGRKGKKARKVEEKFNAQPPRFMYSIGEITKRNHAVRIDDVRELILHLVADAPPPNWLKVENARGIRKVVVLLIPGLTGSLLNLPPLPTSATSNPNLPIQIPLPSSTENGLPSDPGLPFIASTFSHACPTRAPGEPTRLHSVLSSLFHGPLSSAEKKKIIEAKAQSGKDASRRDPSQYVLSLAQMIENDYPVPTYMADVFELSEGWVQVPKYEPGESEAGKTTKEKIYAIDCEMCLTEDGKELTRVCVIDYYSGIVIYDALVKPPKPIIDYLTRWSGITAEALSEITTTLSEVQGHIMNLLAPSASPTPILLGHSLESDLKALKISHPRCIDTAVIFHHPRGQPLKPGLAWLTKKWCKREIQCAGEGGHDPREDAAACVELLKKKVQNGPGFGEFDLFQESIFERMARAPGGIRSAVVDHGNPVVMHGAKATTAIGCTSDEEVLRGLLGAIPAHNFTFGRLMALADQLGWITPKTNADPKPPPTMPTPAPNPEVLESTLKALDTQLQTLQTALPSRTALIILSGHSDPRLMAALNARKIAFESAMASGAAPEAMDVKWTNGDARELEEAVEIAKRGLLFLGIK